MSRLESPARRAMLSATIVLVVLVGTFVVAHALLGMQAADVATHLAQRALERADGVHTARGRIAEQVSNLPYLPCSAEDIDAMKEIASQAMMVSDVGRLWSGHIACSAMKGRILPLALPAPHHVRIDARIWRGLKLPGMPYDNVNVIAIGNVFVVSTPHSYAGLDLPAGSRMAIATADRRFMYLDLSTQPTHSASAELVERFQCSRLSDACAFVAVPRLPLLSLPLPALVLLVAASVLVGGLGCIALLRLHPEGKQSTEQQLCQAFEENEIKLAYQPLRQISDGQLVGFEVLSRWRPGSGGEILPDVFIPMMAHLNLSPILLRHVLSRAVEELREALLAERPLYIAVNAEPQDLAEHGMTDFILRTVRSAGLRPSQVHIEVTERDSISDETRRAMERLRVAGFALLLDDFGVGNSNFSQFAKAQFTGIKIDRILWSIAAGQPLLRQLLPGMCKIADDLELDIVVEGIEDESQAQLLRELVPRAVGQGWFYGMPVPAEDALRLWKSSRA